MRAQLTIVVAASLLIAASTARADQEPEQQVVVVNAAAKLGSIGHTNTVGPVKISANGKSRTVTLGAADELYAAAMVVLP